MESEHQTKGDEVKNSTELRDVTNPISIMSTLLDCTSGNPDELPLVRS